MPSTARFAFVLALIVGSALATSTAASATETEIPPLYEPLPAPARLVDTRAGGETADGQFSSLGVQAADTTLELQVAGRVGVPTDAAAVVLNVTAVDPVALGFLSVFPCGAPRPQSSDLNYYPGVSVPNMVISKVGVDGKVCVYTLAASHIVVDVAGVLPADSYTALDAPQRLLDTRNGGQTTDGTFAGGGTRPAGSILELPVAGRAGIDSDAAVAVLNVTAVDPASDGFLTVYPCGEATPNTSNVNYYSTAPVADMRPNAVPNAAVVRIGTGGSVCIFTLADTDVVVDVAGSFPDTSYLSLQSPQRLLDTRNGAATADGQMSGTGIVPGGTAVKLRVAGRAGLPLGNMAVMLNVTAVDPAEPGFLTVYPAGEARPNASNVNHYAGRTIPNAVIARVGADDSVCVFTLVDTHIVVDVAGLLPLEPTIGPAAGDCDGPQVIGNTAMDLMAKMTVADEQPEGFDRTLFNEWGDPDEDRCSVDELLLIRDSLTLPEVSDTCDVISGRWFSIYDGATLTSPSDVVPDHTVSLKESWDSGSGAWTPERREAFANDLTDMRSLRVVSVAIDDDKQTKDPRHWLPPLESAWCRYLADYIAIKARWGLSMDPLEHGEITTRLIERCPGLQVFAWPAAPW